MTNNVCRRLMHKTCCDTNRGSLNEFRAGFKQENKFDSNICHLPMAQPLLSLYWWSVTSPGMTVKSEFFCCLFGSDQTTRGNLLPELVQSLLWSFFREEKDNSIKLYFDIFSVTCTQIQWGGQVTLWTYRGFTVSIYSHGGTWIRSCKIFHYLFVEWKQLM